VRFGSFGLQFAQIDNGIVHLFGPPGQKNVADWCTIAEPQLGHGFGGIPQSASKRSSIARTALAVQRLMEFLLNMIRWYVCTVSIAEQYWPLSEACLAHLINPSCVACRFRAKYFVSQGENSWTR